MLPMPRFWQSTSRKVILEFDGSGGILNIFFGTEIGCQVATGNLTNLLLILSNLPQWRSLQNTNTKEISKWQRPFQSQFPESLKHLEPVLAPNAPRCFSRPIFGTIPGCSSPRPSTQLDYTIAPGRGTPAPRPLCAPECFVLEIKFTDWRNSEQLLFSNHWINHPSKSSKDLIHWSIGPDSPHLSRISAFDNGLLQPCRRSINIHRLGTTTTGCPWSTPSIWTVQAWPTGVLDQHVANGLWSVFDTFGCSQKLFWTSNCCSLRLCFLFRNMNS